jgi:hypothetical protein
MSDVAPPATAVWYDTAATVAAVFTILRLTDGDVDQARIEALVPAAAGNIDHKLDGTVPVVGPPPPAWAQTALELETVALYRAQGNDIDVSVPLGGFPPPRDALAGGSAVTALVGPHRARWGVA